MKVTYFFEVGIDGIISNPNDRESMLSYKESISILRDIFNEYDAVLLDAPIGKERTKADLKFQSKGDGDIHFEKTDLYENYEKAVVLGFEGLKSEIVEDIFLIFIPVMFGSGRVINEINPLKNRTEWSLVEYYPLQGSEKVLFHYSVKDKINIEESAPSVLEDEKSEKHFLNSAEKEKMEINKKFWNERAGTHINSEFYRLNDLKNGKNLLSDYEIVELGNLSKKRIAHLQCHIGTESISLAFLGAEVTGLDYSEESINIAKKISKQCEVNCKFICADVYDASKVLGKNKFDIIYINFGALTMLPNLNRWCEEVVKLLAPKGFIYINELHPIAAVFSGKSPTVVENYFSSNAKLWNESGSYADGIDERADKKTNNNSLITWDWTLGEILTTLAEHGFIINFVHEHSGHVDKRYTYLQQKDNKKWYSPKGIPDIPGTFSVKANIS